MNLITSTELRTKMPEVITTLLAGGTIDFIHRSRVIGEIKPVTRMGKSFNAERMKKIIDKLNFEPLTTKQIEQRYRSYLMKRYGKYLPRRK